MTLHRTPHRTPHRLLLLLPVAALSAVLAACSSSGDIAQLNADTYMVTAQSRLSGNDGAAAAGVLKAEAWCKERGKRMQMTGSETSGGIFGVLPSKSVVMFKCV